MLLAAVALFYTLVVFNNLTDFDSNYQFVRHVLMMDSTFPGNKAMWRAMSVNAHPSALLGVIALGSSYHDPAVAGLGESPRSGASARGSIQPGQAHRHSRNVASLLMWLVAFVIVGGEWLT